MESLLDVLLLIISEFFMVMILGIAVGLVVFLFSGLYPFIDYYNTKLMNWSQSIVDKWEGK